MTASENHTPQPAEQQQLDKRDRLHERFTVNLPVRVSLITTNGTEPPFETVSADISSSGAFVQTDNPHPIASSVRLEFLISFYDLKKLRFILSLDSLRRFDGKPVWIETTGVVIRHENDGMAVIFNDDYRLSPLHISG